MKAYRRRGRRRDEVTGWTVGDEEGGERVEVPAEPSSASRRDEGF